METIYSVDVKGKVIVVTGGYGHLGKAIVMGLVKHGAKNVYVLGLDSRKFQSIADFQSDKTKFVVGDISDTYSIERAIENVWKQEGRIDVLVNNAVYSKGQFPDDLSDQDWSIGVDGVLGSVFRCIRVIIPYMKKQRHGKIINISSMYGLVAPDFSIYDDSPIFLNPPHYGAAKAGVLQLTRYFASYLGKFDILVNSVTPGPFPSDFVQQDRKFIDKLEKKTLLGRIGKPEDLAGVFVFLASDAANYITGQNFVVDGGWTVR
jgi:NAD(P)-dependent dehydrogenase (short-subunit alcohol dehydrogenase family)